jgi:hypothetical protein
MRVLKVTVAALSVACACTAARPQPVQLDYSFDEPTRTGYRLQARARAEWDIQGRGAGSYDATYEIFERVLAVDDRGALISVTMTAQEIDERNLPAPGRSPTSFRLRVSHDGAVREVLGIQGKPAGSLRPDELVFLGTFRPPLPSRPVDPGERWRSASSATMGAVFRQIATRGTLRALEQRGSTTLATLAYSGQAPLVWTTALPGGRAELSGSADTRGEALFDVERGRLEEATSTTDATFEVRVLPRGDRPAAAGTLRLSLELDLHRQSARA